MLATNTHLRCQSCFNRLHKRGVQGCWVVFQNNIFFNITICPVSLNCGLLYYHPLYLIQLLVFFFYFFLFFFFYLTRLKTICLYSHNVGQGFSVSQYVKWNRWQFPYLLSLGIGLGYAAGQKAKAQKPGKTFTTATCVVFVFVSLCLSLFCVVFVCNLTEVEFMLAFVCMKSQLSTVISPSDSPFYFARTG